MIIRLNINASLSSSLFNKLHELYKLLAPLSLSDKLICTINVYHQKHRGNSFGHKIALNIVVQMKSRVIYATTLFPCKPEDVAHLQFSINRTITDNFQKFIRNQPIK